MTTIHPLNDHAPTAAPLSAEPSLRRISWLDRLSVGQKLGLMALVLGLPVLVLSASQLQQGFRSGTRSVAELRGLEQMATLRALHTGLFRFTSGHVQYDPAVSQAGLSEAEARLRALAPGLGAQSTEQLQMLRRAWASLQDYAKTRDTFTVVNNYQTLVQTHQEPLNEAIWADTGLDLERSPAIAALLRSSTQLGLLTRQMQLLSLDSLLLREPSAARLEAQLTQRNMDIAADALAAYQLAAQRAYRLDPALREPLGKLSGAALSAAQQALDLTQQTLSSGMVSPALMPAYQASLKRLNQSQDATLLATEQQIRARMTRELRQLGLLTALVLGALLGAGALLLTIIRRITQPIRQLTDAAQRLEEGQLRVQVPVTSADELGTLARTFNATVSELRRNQDRSEFQLFEAAQLQQNIESFLDVTMDIAEGDLTRRGQVSEDVLGNVVDSINLMTEELGSVLRAVQGASQSVTDGSKAVLSTTEQIEDGTRTTTREAVQIAGLAQELNQAMRTVAAIARASAEASRRALNASEQGQQAVQGTLEGMSDIRQSAQDAGDRVQALARRSEEIVEIVEAVSHLASQVNLLALHASIEAVGAGAAGARFAVVAEEVRVLADESTAATARIGALVGDLQADIRAVAQGMLATSAQVERGYAVADSAGTRLREIGELAGITAQLAQNISVATEQQVQGISRMSQGTQQIAAVASASQTSAAQAREAAEQLEALAGRLDTSLTRFRLA